MLQHHNSPVIVAVSDLARTRGFYGDVLGLELDESGGEEGVLTYRTGATRLVVYASQEAGHNRGNGSPEPVEGRWCGALDRLRVSGPLDRLGMVGTRSTRSSPRSRPGAQRSCTIRKIGRFEYGVHHVGPMKLVWLKDPDGNILHLNSM